MYPNVETQMLCLSNQKNNIFRRGTKHCASTHQKHITKPGDCEPRREKCMRLYKTNKTKIIVPLQNTFQQIAFQQKMKIHKIGNE
jgi:hypothetical protein